jgi:CheY-like chemotaxis protein
MNRSILVIDDLPDQASLLAEILRRSGSSVAVATSARDGMRAILESATPFDVVVLDMLMPEHSGIAVMNFLKKWRTGPTPPALVIHTAVAGFREKLIEAGYEFDDFIEKPFRPKALIARIEAAARPRPEEVK